MPAAQFSEDAVLELVRTWRGDGRRVVFTNGIFDVLHVGHLRYLQAARSLGDCLIVAVNSDASTRRYKGDKRPIVPEAERAELVAGLACVDAVVLFDDDTAERLVAVLQPDVYVKGGDYAPDAGKPLPEADVVARYGGSVQLIPLVAGRSTTNVIDTIRQRYCGD